MSHCSRMIVTSCPRRRSPRASPQARMPGAATGMPMPGMRSLERMAIFTRSDPSDAQAGEAEQNPAGEWLGAPPHGAELVEVYEGVRHGHDLLHQPRDRR